LIWAKRTVLATGGCGRVYRETSNPPLATGDGYAVAYRAGAILGDMEMVQFHPTTLYVAGSSRALISEAVRGEGAYLIDRNGERFMPRYHPDTELAPRDVVSRAIVQQIRETNASSVYLDVRHIGKQRFARRFPRIARLCAEFQIDVSEELIPVRPAAHYMIGGVVTDVSGRSNVDGLLCCGEAACTGLHGANRLASNSLLEGLVFGARAGETAGRTADDRPHALQRGHLSSLNTPSQRTALDLPDIRNSLRSVMWRNVGIERTGDRLAEASEIIEFWGKYVLDKTFDEPSGWEAQNLLSVGRLVVLSARHRQRSLGVHCRIDEPGTDPHEPPYHLVIQRTAEGPSVRRVGLDFATVV
jgi:L-aspartate oxidase